MDILLIYQSLSSWKGRVDDGTTGHEFFGSTTRSKSSSSRFKEPDQRVLTPEPITDATTTEETLKSLAKISTFDSTRQLLSVSLSGRVDVKNCSLLKRKFKKGKIAALNTLAVKKIRKNLSPHALANIHSEDLLAQALPILELLPLQHPSSPPPSRFVSERIDQIRDHLKHSPISSSSITPQSRSSAILSPAESDTFSQTVPSPYLQGASNFQESEVAHIEKEIFLHNLSHLPTIEQTQLCTFLKAKTDGKSDSILEEALFGEEEVLIEPLATHSIFPEYIESPIISAFKLREEWSIVFNFSTVTITIKNDELIELKKVAPSLFENPFFSDLPLRNWTW